MHVLVFARLLFGDFHRAETVSSFGFDLQP